MIEGISGISVDSVGRLSGTRRLCVIQRKGRAEYTPIALKNIYPTCPNASTLQPFYNTSASTSLPFYPFLLLFHTTYSTPKPLPKPVP